MTQGVYERPGGTDGRDQMLGQTVQSAARWR